MPTKSPPPGLSVRPASDDDCEALLLLRLAAMRESLEQVGRFDPQRARERLSRGFQPKFTRNILLDGELVGFVVVVPLEDSGEWLLDHLYIHPNAQKLGIGSWVMGQVLQEADRHGKAVRVTALRLSDVIVRTGGDEFVGIFPDVGSQDSLNFLGERLLGVFNRPFQVMGHTLQLGCSVGLSMAPGDGATPESLIHTADQAMYRVKQARKSQAQLHAIPGGRPWDGESLTG